MRADLPGRRHALALVLLSTLSTPAISSPGPAQSSDFTEVRDVEVNGSCAWPDQLGKGYLPIRLDLVNTADESRSVSVTATRGWGDDSVRLEAGVALGPGESATVELAAPAWPSPGESYWFQATYSVAVSCGGVESYLSNLGAQETHLGTVLAGVVVSRERAESSVVEGWEAELATSEVEGESHWDGSRQVTEMRGNLDLSSVSFHELPRRFEAYTSLDVVLVDVRRGLPDPTRLEPLLAWVRAGGDAVFAGAGDAREQLAELPTAAIWLEDRFVQQDLGAAVVWRCGLGRIAAQVPDPGGLEGSFPGRGGRNAVEWLLEHDRREAPGPATPVHEMPSIPGLGELPYRVFALLLVLFALAIGPLNFFLVQRAGRPALLLLTIPATAFAAAALFLFYGLLHQGIDVKAASRSLAVLDQRTHRAASAEAREVFVGLTPGGGLRPGAGTVVLPIEESGFSRGVNARYRIDERGSTRLSGRFLPARLPVDQVILTERAARVRLDVVRAGDGLRVTNGLNAAVLGLRLTAPDGGTWQLAGELAQGASADLEPWEEAPAAPGEDLHPSLRQVHEKVFASAPATYAVALDRNPVRDDCGVEATETSSSHVLLGVLDASPEAWR